MKILTFVFLLLLSPMAFGAQRGPIIIEPILVESSNLEYVRSKNLVFGRKWDVERSRDYFYVYGRGLTVQDCVWFPKVFGLPERIINIGQGDYADSGFRFTNTHRAMVLSTIRGGGLVYSPTTNNFINFQTSPNAFYAVGIFIQESLTLKTVDKFRFILHVRNEANEPRRVRWRFYFYRDGPDNPLVPGFVTVEMEADGNILFSPTLEMLTETAGREITFGIFPSPFDPEITVP